MPTTLFEYTCFRDGQTPEKQDMEWMRKLGYEYPEVPQGVYARNADFEPSTLDAEKMAFDCVVATEKRCLMPDWTRRQMVEEILLMDGAEFPARGVSLLNSHCRWGCESVYGSTRELRVEDDKLIGRNYFDTDDTEAVRVFNKYRNGHMNGFSAGYRVTRPVYVEPGKSKTINGRTFTAGKMPLRLAVRWQLLENSCVVIGADSTAVSRHNNFTTSIQEDTTVTFEDFCRMMNVDPRKMNAGQRAAMEALYAQRTEGFSEATEGKEVEGLKKRAAEIMAPSGEDEAAPAAPTAQRSASGFDANQIANTVNNVLNEREARQRKQNEENQRALKDFFSSYPEYSDMASTAKREGWSLNEAKDAVLEKIRSGYSSVGHVPSRQDNGPDGAVRTMELALLLSTGMVNEERLAKDYGGDLVDSVRKEYRGYGLRAAVEDFARMSGHHVPRMFDEDTIRTALHFSKESEYSRAGGVTGISMPGILSNVAGKIMLQQYETIGNVSDKLCRTGTANDFKKVTRYRMVDGGRFKPITNGGELKQGSFGEQTYENQLETFGRIDWITRQMMFDDDLGALADLAWAYGRNAIILKDELFFTRLLNALDNAKFFVADKNRFSGADTAFGLGGMTKADEAFENQLDSAGRPIMVPAKYVVVPTTLKTTATTYFSTKNFAVTGTENKADIVTENPHHNTREVISSPFLNTLPVLDAKGNPKKHANASTTRWFQFADPRMLAAFEMLYLRGRTAPVFERVESTPEKLAIGVRSYFDVGVGEMDEHAVQAMDGK